VLLKNLFAPKRSDFGHGRDDAVISPTRMLQIVNRELLAAEVGKYATMCVATLDLLENRLWYSVAGHLPVPILCGDNDCRWLTGSNPPVGLYPDVDYAAESIQLPEQFTLTLLSDGVLEMLEGSGLRAKEEKLLEAMSPKLTTMD